MTVSALIAMLQEVKDTCGDEACGEIEVCIDVDSTHRLMSPIGLEFVEPGTVSIILDLGEKA
jgi:hypothetical protein